GGWITRGGIGVAAPQRGQNLVTPGAFQATHLADATVEVLRDAKPLKHGTRVRFHQGTVELLGRVAVIGPLGDPVAPGARGCVRLGVPTAAMRAGAPRSL